MTPGDAARMVRNIARDLNRIKYDVGDNSYEIGKIEDDLYHVANRIEREVRSESY